ncbi:ABC transporter ATP-binding protein [Nakamurella sp. GG22]
MGDTPVVELRHVTVRFPGRKRPALSDVSLVVRPGEELIVFGASGSGKSTLLQVMSGVVPLSEPAELTGAVLLNGHDARGVSVVERSRALGVLRQDPASGVCLPAVDQEIALVCENHAVAPSRISTRIDDVLALVGARELRDRFTHQLSGGELQRVALAAAVAVPPALLLLDEPTSMLDPAGVRAVRNAVGAVRSSVKAAVVLVEHRLDEYSGGLGLEFLPGRCVILHEGRVVADGATAEVLPAHARLLHEQGCWLPLEAELTAVSGRPPGSSVAVLDTPVAAQIDRSFAPSPPVLTASGVAAGRHGNAVVAGLDLELRSGEVVAVAGANGSGKSTVLLTLAGLLRPVAGTVRGARPGMVFQNPEHGFVGRTVIDEIGENLPRGSPAIAEQLDRHGLAQCAAQNPFRLSGGEKRRLSIAAMLAQPREVLIADEPTYGLDRTGSNAVAAAVANAANDGRAVLFSAHDLRLVGTLADRMVVLGSGRVLATGPSLALLRDRALCARAGLAPPAVLRRLFSETPDDALVRATLRALDRRRAPAATALR